jgi:hypothetical protein
MMIVGCGQLTEGTATRDDDTPVDKSTPQSSPPPNGYAWLKSVMPSSEELTRAAGYRVTIDEPPTVHDGDFLRDTIVGSRDVTNIECLGVVSPFESRVYQDAPVVAITFATEAVVTFGAAALSSDAAADQLFEKFVAQWQQCLGKTLVKTGGAGTFENKITVVEAGDDVTSAVIELTTDSPTGIPVRVFRAVGVAKDCIVEADVGINEPEPGPAAPDINGAADLVQSMLSRINAVRP